MLHYLEKKLYCFDSLISIKKAHEKYGNSFRIHEIRNLS